ncbi:hypothetical protein OUZ56_019700 [Daphnia magna]|uniref:Uncharacterized protein n=1 Tax=Daphnia magna TaxID=35525 RepID=A0ABQ9ZCX2_9CRUS|nr:hypothetical protein OUZ56_019700 [Daphnia magna]
MGAIPEKAEEFPVSATYWLKKSNTQPWLRCLLHTTAKAFEIMIFSWFFPTECPGLTLTRNGKLPTSSWDL